MKHIIVTGASRGIGYELVKQFCAKGNVKVLALSRNEEKLNELKSFCDANYPTSAVVVLAYDLGKEDYTSDLLPLIRTEFSSVDILINNAGYLVAKAFTDLTSKELFDVYNVNVFAAFRLTQLLFPRFHSNSHVVNVSSVGGIQGSVKFPGLSAYSSSKAAMVGLTECLAEEYKDHGLAVNCLALGAVQTEMLEEAFPGYQAPLSATQMASYISEFAWSGHQFYKGKVLPVSMSTP